MIRIVRVWWAVFGSGVRFVVDFAQTFDRHVRVDLSRVEILVADQRLDRAQVRTAFQHERCRCVTEESEIEK